MSCDVGEATEGLANEALLILQPFRLRFSYVTGEPPVGRHSSYGPKGKSIPITSDEGPLGDVDASAHIYETTALGRGRVASLRSATFTPILQEAVWTQD